MDMIMAKLQEWAGRAQSVEGRLAEAPSAALDAFCKALALLQGPVTLSPQAAAAIVAGMQVAQEVARGGQQNSSGFWAYQFERFSPAGTSVIFKRDPPAPAEAGFQLDNENRLHGIFYIHLGDLANGQEYAFSLKQTFGKWMLVKWQDDQETLYPLTAPGGEALWNPTPKMDLWDDLVPTGGQDLTGGQASPAGLLQPDASPQENPLPLEAIGDSLAATMIRPRTGAALSLILIFEKGGNSVPMTGRLTIGRGKENDLCLEDSQVSRNHAVIEPMAGGWQIHDLDSSNGTWLNDKRITGTAPLKIGDVLRLGETRLRLEIAQE